ncbi:MAG: SMI1/KNR4 family protein, partial [Planctomycetota bacterium]
AFSARFEQPLPSAYVDFLRRLNGARPRDCWVEVPAIGERVQVDAFFGINDPELNLERLDEINLDYLPEGCFAFAKDPFGNQFVMDLMEGGSVAYWDCNDDYHEIDGDGEDGNLFDIADSFTAFLQALQPGGQTIA